MRQTKPPLWMLPVEFGVTKRTVPLRLRQTPPSHASRYLTPFRWQTTCLLSRGAFPFGGGVVSTRSGWILKVLAIAALAATFGSMAYAQTSAEEGKRKVKTKVAL